MLLNHLIGLAASLSRYFAKCQNVRQIAQKWYGAILTVADWGRP